jgi:hypothetical protein
VLQVTASLFSILLSLVSVATQDIEKAFLLNSASQLHVQFSRQSRLSLYLPEPLSFSDQLSNEQAFFFFQNIFARYSTLEFFPEPGGSLRPGRGHFIFKARWSFQDTRTGDRFVFRLYFLLEREQTAAPSSARGRPGRRRTGLPWKIAEIKAEKI